MKVAGHTRFTPSPISPRGRPDLLILWSENVKRIAVTCFRRLENYSLKNCLDRRSSENGTLFLRPDLFTSVTGFLCLEKGSLYSPGELLLRKWFSFRLLTTVLFSLLAKTWPATILALPGLVKQKAWPMKRFFAMFFNCFNQWANREPCFLNSIQQWHSIKITARIQHSLKSFGGGLILIILF